MDKVHLNSSFNEIKGWGPHVNQSSLLSLCSPIALSTHPSFPFSSSSVLLNVFDPLACFSPNQSIAKRGHATGSSRQQLGALSGLKEKDACALTAAARSSDLHSLAARVGRPCPLGASMPFASGICQTLARTGCFISRVLWRKRFLSLNGKMY